MKNRKLKITALALALLIAASSVMVSCSNDKDNGTASDTSGMDTQSQQVEPNLPTGDDGTETAPPPVIAPTTEPQTPETEPPVDTPVTEDPIPDVPSYGSLRRKSLIITVRRSSSRSSPILRGRRIPVGLCLNSPRIWCCSSTGNLSSGKTAWQRSK